MIKSNLPIIFILSFAMIFGTAAQSDCNSKKNKITQTNNEKTQNTGSNNKMANEKSAPKPGGEIKVLAEGSYGQMEEPFLFVARDPESYARLKNMLENLPPATGINFNDQAVVAAFAGTRNTGGYSVEIRKSGDAVSVSLNSPPADAIVTQALTMPYKIAAVSLGTGNSLNLTIGESWEKAARSYKVSSGEFEYSGGIAGRKKSFAAEGEIDVFRFNNLVTLRLNLSGAGENRNMKLTETVSGVLSGEKIEITSLNAGSFSENPKPPLKVSGTIAGDKLILSFEPLPTMVSDGYQARGRLEAVESK